MSNQSIPPYKYIVINKTSDEVIIKNSVREISDFIGMIYPKSKLSHNSVSQRLNEKSYFNHYDLLIKELKWI